MKDVTTTVTNPQGHAICDQFHQTIRKSLQSMLWASLPYNIDPGNNAVETCFATAAYET